MLYNKRMIAGLVFCEGGLLIAGRPVESQTAFPVCSGLGP